MHRRAAAPMRSRAPSRYAERRGWYSPRRTADGGFPATGRHRRADSIAPAASLHRLDLGESRFPEPQDVLRNVEIVGDLADGSEGIRRLVQMLAPLSLAPAE